MSATQPEASERLTQCPDCNGSGCGDCEGLGEVLAPATPNDLTCATMDATAVLAEQWARGDLHETAQEDLTAWVRLRMRAYADGGWDGERGPMVEWIAMDLAISDDDALNLCNESGWTGDDTAKRGAADS